MKRVMKGLECCEKGMDLLVDCGACPYEDFGSPDAVCITRLMQDARELLKAQEPRVLDEAANRRTAGGGTMGRLIDGDKLESAVASAVGIMRANGLDVTCAGAIMPIIKYAPAVDAIPVAWLEAQIVPYNGDAGDVRFTAHNVTLKNIMRKWHAEQREAAPWTSEPG